MSEREKSVLAALVEREDLAEKKTRIYARLLTDAAVVKTLQELAESHRKSRETLSAFLGIETENGGSRCGEKEEKADA